jgi:hypothetical protein
MTERRNQILVEERRQVRRTILTEFVGAFIVLAVLLGMQTSGKSLLAASLANLIPQKNR